jgi:hypothetical protein
MRTSRATRAVLAVAGCGSDTTVAASGTEPATSPGQYRCLGLHRQDPGGRCRRSPRTLRDDHGIPDPRSTEDESGMLQVAVARFPTPDDAARAARVVHDFEQVHRTTPLASDPSGHRNRSDRQGRVERLPHGPAPQRRSSCGTTSSRRPGRCIRTSSRTRRFRRTSPARCWSGDVAQGRASVCLMVYGRYMAELSGLRPVGNEDPANDSLRTMSQRLATQYVKFVRSEEMGLGEN